MIALLHKLIDWIFFKFPAIEEFSFLALPLNRFGKDLNGLFNAKEWQEYLDSHQKLLCSLPKGLDRQSISWVKTLLYRRRRLRYFLKPNEIYRYYRAKRLALHYLFPENGTLLKSVFYHKAGTIFIPSTQKHLFQNRIAIDGGAASGDSSLTLLDCGVSRVLAV